MGGQGRGAGRRRPRRVLPVRLLYRLAESPVAAVLSRLDGAQEFLGAYGRRMVRDALDDSVSGGAGIVLGGDDGSRAVDATRRACARGDWRGADVCGAGR